MDIYEEVALSEKLKDDLKEISDMLSKITPLPELRPVIPCKNCIHWSKRLGGYCSMIDMSMEEEDYCSYAERKEE